MERGFHSLPSLGVVAPTHDCRFFFRLATAYWFSVEFGLCRERGELKAYGAGLLSSVGELEYACGGGREGPPAYREFDPVAASLQDYPITHFQPLYYVADSLTDAEAKIGE